VLHAGLATHYIPSAMLPELQTAILNCLTSQKVTAGDNNVQLETSLRSILNQFQSRTPLPSGELPKHFDTISGIFGGGKESLEEIYDACKDFSRGGEFGRMAAELMTK
jgi:Enoyl-CoA hydratase/isomerase